jgi:DNA primase catalytic core, N-terminal domain
MEAAEVLEERVPELLADAGAFFEADLWESDTAGPARDLLAGEDLEEEVIRAFGVGYAPMGPYQLMNHLTGLGYSPEELVAAGLATRSVRGRVHAYFRSRVMFPVRDREGRILGFAGLATHLAKSWALWITSHETALYQRSDAVFAIDRAAPQIAATSTALVLPDCIEVLRSHQDRKTNAVTVHTSSVTREQLLALAGDVPGGIDALEVDVPPGMQVHSERVEVVADPGLSESSDHSRSVLGEAVPAVRHLPLKRLVLVTATALAAINLWTGAPLLAIWVGSQVQHKSLLSMGGVITVVVVLAALAFLLGWALTWLSAKYDQLTGRPVTAGQTSPWHRSKRGDRVQDIRSRYGISAPEKVVVGCVVAGFLAFEVWFFFFAGSSI